MTYQFAGVHELVDPLNRDLALDEEYDEHGENVERDSQEVEERQRDEGRVGVQHVGRVRQHIGREGGLKYVSSFVLLIDNFVTGVNKLSIWDHLLPLPPIVIFFTTEAYTVVKKYLTP